jgi:hypothetical protein
MSEENSNSGSAHLLLLQVFFFVYFSSPPAQELGQLVPLATRNESFLHT